MSRGGIEVFFEIQQIGSILRVSAIDSLTQTEVVIQGPASAGQEALKRAALAKLEYRLKKDTTL